MEEKEEKVVITFKKPLTSHEQVHYLEDCKRVVFNDISKENAQDFLYLHNYINAITPYKYNFAKKDENGNVIRDENHNHIYERDIDFTEYKEKYSNERKEYPILYTAILDFETKFNSIVSNEVAVYYSLDSLNSFNQFKTSLLTNVGSSKNSESAKATMKSKINKYDEYLDKYGSVFILLDRLPFGELVTLFKACDKELKFKIFKEMEKRNLTFGYVKFSDFEKILVKVIWIRNTIMHGNSLTILFRYYDVKNKVLRSRDDADVLKSLKDKILSYYESIK